MTAPYLPFESPAPGSVLLVEDDPAFARQLSATIAAQAGHPAVRTFDGPRAALAGLGDIQPAPQLALLDLGLADPPVTAVIRALRERRPGLRVRVLSTVGSETRVLQALQAGADGYVRKDDTPAGIAMAVEEALLGIVSLSPALARLLRRLLLDAGLALPTALGEVLLLTARGHPPPEVAAMLGESTAWVQVHLRAACAAAARAAGRPGTGPAPTHPSEAAP